MRQPDQARKVVQKISLSELKSPAGYEQLPQALMAWHANILNIQKKPLFEFPEPAISEQNGPVQSV
ncbi:MAG: hypothetical protein ACOX4K_06195 [Bacillota bacterium]|jgi:hypothetical protein